MRTGKLSSVPASGRRALRFPVKDWSDPSLTHMRIQGDALVCCEKLTQEFVTPLFGGLIYETMADKYCTFVTHSMQSLAETTRLCSEKYVAYTPIVSDLTGAMSVPDWSGNTHEYLALGNDIYEYDGNARTLTGKGAGPTTTFVLFRERIFGAYKNKLFWSATAREDYSFSQTDAQGAGSVELPDIEEGDILKLFPYGEKMFVFRERSIMVLTAYADPLDFKLKRICSVRENIKADSIALCGDVFYFCTDVGLRTFNCRSVSAIGTDPRVVFSDNIYGGTVNGAYYASVPTSDGSRMLFTLSDAPRGGRLFGGTHQKASAGRKFYVQNVHTSYSIGGKALPAEGACEARFALSVSPQCDGAKFVEGIIFEGKGDFTVELTADGVVHRASGRAGKRLRFPEAVRGECFGLKVTTRTEDFALYAVTLCVRREELHDD